MDCPACQSSNTHHLGDRRPKRINGTTWRLHECRDCGHRFPSVQRVPTEDDYLEADIVVAERMTA